MARTWRAEVPGSAKLSALRRVAARAVADRLLALASDQQAAPEVRAVAEFKIAALRALAVGRGRAGSDASRAEWYAIAGDFARWIERREVPQPTPALEAPPGDPFGVGP